MKLLAVHWLWLLWAIPIAVVILRVAASRARARTREFLGELVPRMVRGGGTHVGRAGLCLGAVGLSIVALARPAWGVVIEEVESEGLEMVVLLDVSRSMLVEDAAPNRLERARFAVDRLLDRLEESGGHRIGLVAFAGLSVVRAPVTSDYEYVRERLRATAVADVPRGGTLIGDAVRRATQLLARPGDHDRVVIVLTDGEDHESFPLEAARAAADAGVAIYTVGIGDATDGGHIPLTQDDGARTYVTQGGSEVVSRLDEDTLRKMAAATGGGYLPAGTRSIPLDRLYDEAIEGRRTAHIASATNRTHVERFQWAVGLALVLALASRFTSPKERER